MEFATSAAAYNQINLPLLPLPLLALFLFCILPCAVVLGYVSGVWSHRRAVSRGREIDTRIGETTVGAFLAILGLLLAFSFGSALSMNAATKTSLTEEAAALGTVFLRTDFLEEPGRTQLRRAIFGYTQTRVVPGEGVIRTQTQVQTFLETSLRAQSALWPLTVKHTAEVPPPIQTFFASAMNDVLDAHLHRMRTLSEPISIFSQLMVLGAALAALFLLGNRAGLIGRSLTWRTFVLCVFLFIVMTTITEIGRSAEGWIKVDDAPLRATLDEMRLAL